MDGSGTRALVVANKTLVRLGLAVTFHGMALEKAAACLCRKYPTLPSRLCSASQNLFRCSVAAGYRTMNRSIVPGGVSRFTREKQRILHWAG